MRKGKNTFAVIAIIVAIVLVGGWAFAHGAWAPRGHRDPGRGYGYPYSNLSPEQRERLQAQEQKFYQDTAQLRRELYQKRLELRSLWIDPKADPERIKAKQREIFDLQRQLQDKALEHRMAVRGLLPEDIIQGPCGSGCGMGYGPPHGGKHMWGPGPGAGKGYGGGPCW